MQGTEKISQMDKVKVVWHGIKLIFFGIIATGMGGWAFFIGGLEQGYPFGLVFGAIFFPIGLWLLYISKDYILMMIGIFRGEITEWEKNPFKRHNF